ncbi:PD40 domain-containing protein [Phototrophicus methaneseepsis]|uniref:PD40 domain-containing protein n=1 Tax=Phototrophicus methaneseepsis TaxID=2710758 RepID=A0A7S8E8Z4_9CHLR|nr:PD40 domain-containing protein [Phototrophicus methaneseepsis]QPC82567.1 PD40 domain-containing protein [Phototrophicus methaneseepsis]
MTEKATPKRNVSRFDLIVIGTIGLALLATIAIAILSTPEERGPSVAYLAPYASGGVPNIWIAPLDDPSAAEQVTFTKIGVFDFDVSADGRFIVYAARDGDSDFNDIYLLNLQTGSNQRITACQEAEADCTSPAYRDTGDLVAYVRVDTNISVPNVGPGAQRVWVIDIRQQPYQTRPLAGNSQIIGHSPQWADDGRSIAFFSSDIGNSGVMYYNYAPTEGQQPLLLMASEAGEVGTLSPDGSQLVYPTFGDSGGYNRHLNLVNTTDAEPIEPTMLTPDDGSVDDATADFHPSGQKLLIERRYEDEERRTNGHQLYQYDMLTGNVTPLVVDAHFQHGLAHWNATGDKIVFQRVRLYNQDGTPATLSPPEVWVFDVAEDNMTLISDNGFWPVWVAP